MQEKRITKLLRDIFLNYFLEVFNVLKKPRAMFSLEYMLLVLNPKQGRYSVRLVFLLWRVLCTMLTMTSLGGGYVNDKSNLEDWMVCQGSFLMTTTHGECYHGWMVYSPSSLSRVERSRWNLQNMHCYGQRNIDGFTIHVCMPLLLLQIPIKLPAHVPIQL